MPSKKPKKPKPMAMGYFIGSGAQHFGSSVYYRCVFCQLVSRTRPGAEEHERICPERLASKRRATKAAARKEFPRA